MNSVQTQVVDDYIKKAESLKKELETVIGENDSMFKKYMEEQERSSALQQFIDSGAESVSRKAVFAKLGLIQADVEGVTKSAFLKLSDKTGYKYVPWTALVEMIEPLLGKHKVILETIPYDMKTEYKNNNVEALFYCKHKFIDCDSGESYLTPSKWLASGAGRDTAKAIKAAMSNEKATFIQSFFNVPVENETEQERNERVSDEKFVSDVKKVFPEAKVAEPLKGDIISEAEKTEWFNKFKAELDGDKETVGLWLSLTKPWLNGERLKTNQLTKDMFYDDITVFKTPKLAQAILMYAQSLVNKRKLGDKPETVNKILLEESGKNKLSELKIEEISSLIEVMNKEF